MLNRLRRFLTRSQEGPPADEAGDVSASRELARLEQRLREEKVKTEQLAKISYAKWKLRKEQEKEYALKFGVTLPLTTMQQEQDDFFRSLESRMERQRIDFIEQNKALEFQQGEEQKQELERQSAECVLKALEDDLT
ncbi:MAG: hypothetical protein HQL44_08740 [Alphaproteobacteria bacterium]|nr:hypothetical protein [Alphaproteobacteria bacterium]